MKTAFSLAEVLVSMMLLSLLLAISMPVITLMKTSAGIDKNTRSCIVVDGGNSLSNSCVAATNSCKYGQNSSCSTLNYLSSQSGFKTIAENIIKQVCDLGGAKACDLIIHKCIGSSADCSVANGFDTYLSMDSNSTNSGRAYIQNNCNSFYTSNVTNIKSRIDTLCTDCNAMPKNTACAIKCPFVPQIITVNNAEISRQAVKDCNTGNTTACQNAYNNNWNRSCNQIMNNAYTFTGINNKGNDIYKLTYDSGAGNIQSYNAFCDMNRGGWTLVMKVDSASATFRYSSALWTDCNTLTPASTDLSFAQHKNLAYCHAPISSIMLGEPANNAGHPNERMLTINVTPDSKLKDLVSGGQTLAVGMTNWKSMFESCTVGSTVFQEGFSQNATVNIAMPPFTVYNKVRIGGISSVSGKGNKTIGFGVDAQEPMPMNTSVGCDFPYWGYIYVK